MSLLDSLNAQQRRAVESIDGPLLVLAGAGTGKTRVLTCRIAHILAERRAWPSQILAATFTNKAAAEMRGRVTALIGAQGEEMGWLGTFHRIGARILRRHGEAIGLRRNFTILDQNDQTSLLKRLLQSRNIDAKRHSPGMFAALIDDWKNRGLMPEEIPQTEARAGDGKGIALYQDYQERLRSLHAVDFGDLLLEPLRLLREHADIRAEYEERFRYILVDEYQDTNIVQYLWLRLLARKRRNLCCVGDDDQSIYSWRGAQISNILNFNKDFPEAEIIRLERNYRSTGNILKAASGLIEANGNRLGKTLWTEDGAGEKLRVRGCADSWSEARQIAADIVSLQASGHRLDDIAVLVRVTAQMRELEECFLDHALPYRVIGGLRFYERAEVRDINAYLRLILQPDDDIAFERVVNRPRRGLGEGALENIRALARSRGVSLSQAARLLADNPGGGLRARKSLAAFLDMLDAWRKAHGDTAPALLARQVMAESGYRDMWKHSSLAEAPGRLENLDELLRSIEPFETLESYLEHVSLLLDADQQSAAGKTLLMTLHSAKGLEFGTVFLPGWEEGLFPHQRSIDEDRARGGRDRLEEERRLAYVGITRARRRACISFTMQRRIYGSWQSAAPSRFLEELPREALDVTRRAAPESAPSAGPMRQPVSRRVLPDAAAEMPHFPVGARVFHQKFGYGQVREQDGDRLSIAFDKAGEKRIIASFVEPAPLRGEAPA